MTLTATTHLGPYEIVSILGSGGMGEVYRARDSRLERDVAIKVLPERLARDPLTLARFLREARAVAALSHPNIVALYDIGAEQGMNYVVMELLEGETLGRRLKQARLAWREALEIALAVAEGLSAAHAKGLIHRDIKPENIFLTTSGGIKILDFGLVRQDKHAPPHRCWGIPSRWRRNRACCWARCRTWRRSRSAASKLMRAAMCSPWAVCFTRS